VSGGLSKHQRESLDRYFGLMKSHPELFSDRLHRPIVREPGILKVFAQKHNAALGVLAETPYLWLVNDLVQGRDSSGAILYYTYLRIIAPPGQGGAVGVVALATVRPEDARDAESVVLVEQERHATGTLELELPRGFADPGEPAELHVLQELKTETGYIGEHAEYLGTTLTDSGTTDRAVAFFHVPVTGRVSEAPELHEAIFRTVLVTREELWSRILTGAVRDAFTVQALALYERRVTGKKDVHHRA
jgi:ADP-ribose pyrophosphatase